METEESRDLFISGPFIWLFRESTAWQRERKNSIGGCYMREMKDPVNGGSIPGTPFTSRSQSIHDSTYDWEENYSQLGNEVTSVFCTS